MLVTSKVKLNPTLSNKEQLVDSLFGKIEGDIKPEFKVPFYYKDQSYDRYMTRAVISGPPRSQKILHHYYMENKIKKITDMIQNWAEEHALDLDPSEMYDEFKIPKASGGHRTIEAPHDILKDIQNQIRYELNWVIPVHSHDAAYAYVKGRDTVKAIKRHQDNGSNWFLKIDLKDFFGSIDHDTIHQELKRQFPYALMNSTSYDDFTSSLGYIALRNDKLPQGTPLSPMLTNMVMLPFDYLLSKRLPTDQLIIYTRYADDLIFSSRHPIDVKRIIEIIETIFRETNLPFKINHKKTRYGNKAGRNWNLGIMYNKERDMTVGYRRKKKIKTLLFQFYKCYNNNSIDKDFTLMLQGELAYLKNVEQDYHNKLLNFMDNKYNFKFHNKITEVLKR